MAADRDDQSAAIADFSAQFDKHALTPSSDGFKIAPPSPNTARRFLRARKGVVPEAVQQFVDAELWRHERVRSHSISAKVHHMSVSWRRVCLSIRAI